MLKEALIQLLLEKPLEKITIIELCNQAQINRTTFYKHYGSQYDLLNDIESDIFAELEKHLLADGDEFENLIQILKYLERERRKCLVLVNLTPQQSFAERLFSLSAIHKSVKNKITENYIEMVIAYISFLLLWCVCNNIKMVK